MFASPQQRLALDLEDFGYTLEDDGGPLEGLCALDASDNVDAREDCGAVGRIEQAQFDQRGKACVDLGKGFGAQSLERRIVAILEVDHPYVVPGVGKGVRDATPHASGTQRGDDRR